MSSSSTQEPHVSLNAIDNPSKWDIIPIHTSDRATFKDCRRKWAWSSPSKSNLVPKASVHGVRWPLWFGTGIHKALEKKYNPSLQEDPTAVWVSWFDLQWNGGVVTEDELGEFADREPQKHGENWYVRGLDELLPVPEIKMNSVVYTPEEAKALGVGMLEFYKTFSEEEDDFTVIAVEHDFSVPILDPQGKPLYMPDYREMPDGWEPNTAENIYGPLTTISAVRDQPLLKQVHARGRMDKIVLERQGRYGILDHKTTSRLDDDYFRHLELDEQCTTYLWAGEREAKLYNLEYDNLDFIIYEAIQKAYPKPPTPLRNGMPSVDRQKESTTAKMFEQYILDNNLKVVFDADPKLQGYYTWLLEKGDSRFIDRQRVWRNRSQRTNAGIRLYYEAVDMLSNPKLYPNPRNTYSCINCSFRAPCIAAEDGSDWQSMIEQGYISNWDR